MRVITVGESMRDSEYRGNVERLYKFLKSTEYSNLFYFVINLSCAELYRLEVYKYDIGHF